MSEIMRCVFEKREPVRNVTALALMQYACEEFPRSRVDVVGGVEWFRVLRIVNRANTLSRRYGWRTRWLPLPSVEPLPYPEWRAYFVDPTKPDFAFEHMQAHNV